MKVALVHECIVGYHGSERVLAALAEMYPDAPIYVTILDRQAIEGTPLEPGEFHCSSLDRLPLLRKRHRMLLPLMPMAVERHDLRGYDLVISSHHAVSHGVLTTAEQTHISYTHSPARYAWDLVHEHLPPGRALPIKRYAMHRFRLWDVAAGQRPDVFIANSQNVANRIGRIYRRDAQIIHPPVEVDRFAPVTRRDDFYVTLGRLVGYKNTNAVIAAFNQLNKPLHVIGDGPDLKKLQHSAKNNVRFIPDADDAQVADQLNRCKALIFASHEDFGIAPVEAMAAGAPVIALRRGGVLETVTEGQTGRFFYQPDPDAIIATVQQFESVGVSCSPVELRQAAMAYRPDRFKAEFERVVHRTMADKS
jgi:glycosyltransferase involved in cell wall biosynthesis